jgi:hypothetical protein
LTENLAAALALFQLELPDVTKDKTAKVTTKNGPNYSYAYADLHSISAVVLPLLGKHGLSWSCGPDLEDGKFVLRWRLLHASGGQLTGAYPLPDRAGPQETGSALTYAKRYALCAVTGVSPAEDDDDGQKAQAGYRDDPDAWANARPANPARVRDAGNTDHGRDPQLRTDAQSRRMFQLLNQADIKGREAAHTFIAETIGHPVESTKDLTREECGLVIATLETAAAEKVGHDEQP